LYSIHWSLDIKKTIHCIKGWNIQYLSQSESIFLPRKYFLRNERTKDGNMIIMEWFSNVSCFVVRKQYSHGFQNMLETSIQDKKIFWEPLAHMPAYFMQAKHTLHIYIMTQTWMLTQNTHVCTCLSMCGIFYYLHIKNYQFKNEARIDKKY